jgi:hypothetical protein
MSEGTFIRILYSNSMFVLNGIYLTFSLDIISNEKYYNKHRCNFDLNAHRELIENIRQIEEGLLKKVSIRNKTPQYKITEQLRNGNIKIFTDNVEKMNTSSDFLLKISGIWETEMSYGVTYKFIKMNNV